MSFNSMSEEQVQVTVNAKQLFDYYAQTKVRLAHYNGSMHWKKSGGKDYLYRGYTGGRAISLGSRSSETEAIKTKFDLEKAETKTLYADLSEKIKLHASFIRAVKLNRLPETAARVIRLLNNKKIPYRIIGTNSLYAYEQRAGVMIHPQHLATMDVDILMDARQRLKIAAKLDQRSLLNLIRAADQSFNRLTPDQYEFAAINKSGYRVDFITQGSSPISESAFSDLLKKDDLSPIEFDSLKWPVNSPKFSEIVFDTKGYPVKVDTIDPRAFVLHKWYTSKRADRETMKRGRDATQSRVVASMIHQHLLGVDTTDAIRRLFPNTVVQSANDDDLMF